MGELSHNRPYYVAVWRVLLRDWLGWSEEQFGEWEARFDADLDDRGNPLFYHEDELYYVVPQLIPRELADRLMRVRSTPGPNALDVLLQELHIAIMGGPFRTGWGTPTFDWNAARERVAAVLRRHGVELGAK